MRACSDDDWKRWLKLATPWIVTAGVIALGVSAYNKHVSGDRNAELALGGRDVTKFRVACA